MRILRHRATRHFVAVLIGCDCGRRFMHRLDRPMVACLVCGRLGDLAALVAPLRSKRRAERRLSPRAARRSAVSGGGSTRRR
jgi:hypothetical protein